ncbi:MAG TPA: NADH-quinone oxidoreductase subunit J [Bellilinea sp.]|jgi:NADH-quinone oxidoreductase subunit J|nr:NADH-quinone oxidoreductase subunit J [Bellilinea sp.]
MTALQIVFLIVAAITAFSAVMMVTTRKMMHAVLWLVLALLGVAVIFATLQASFFAVVQILVYIGAISILIIFSVMLTRKVMEDTGPQIHKYWWVAALAAVALFGLILVFLNTWPGFSATLEELPGTAENIQGLGQALVDPAGFVVPFEVASILLLAALIGAIFVAVDRKEKP